MMPTLPSIYQSWIYQGMNRNAKTSKYHVARYYHLGLSSLAHDCVLTSNGGGKFLSHLVYGGMD